MDEAIKSEWNEQQLFAGAYFNEHKNCRLMQKMGDWKSYNSSVRSKLSCALGILNTTVTDNLFNELKPIDNLICNYGILKENLNRDKFFKNEEPPELSFFAENILSKLIQFENLLDKEVNKVMPFLNAKKGIDIRGL